MKEMFLLPHANVSQNLKCSIISNINTRYLNQAANGKNLIQMPSIGFPKVPRKKQDLKLPKFYENLSHPFRTILLLLTLQLCLQGKWCRGKTKRNRLKKNLNWNTVLWLLTPVFCLGYLFSVLLFSAKW